MRSSAVIYSAPWVIPVDQPPIADGGVACADGKILSVDSFSTVQQQFPHLQVQHYTDCALTPSLINAHTHLELSYAGELAQGQLPATFTGWIEALLSYRDNAQLSQKDIEKTAVEAARQQYASGVSVIADIGNTSVGASIEDFFPGTLLPFKEYLGLTEDRLPHNLERLALEPDRQLCSAHAVYSTHEDLLRAVKNHCRSIKSIFPIHCAEPLAEIDMVTRGEGELVSFLKRRGFWEETFREKVTAKNFSGTIEYLDFLGLLDEHTLCVHAVQVTDREIEILTGKKVKVCLCPGSNRFLGVGKPPVQSYLEAGILPALGTDSLASNPLLSLWREMQLLHHDHQDIKEEIIFAMATLGGAEALQVQDKLGSLSKGKNADILAIPLDETVNKASQVYQFLITTGHRIAPIRLAYKEVP